MAEIEDAGLVTVDSYIINNDIDDYDLFGEIMESDVDNNTDNNNQFNNIVYE